MSAPTDIVAAFIADYFRWNAAANERDRLAGRSTARQEAAMAATEREWAAILANYCRPGFTGESISYGIPPLHDPDREEVVSSTPRGTRCLVRTKTTQSLGGMSRDQEFEYRLSRTGERWYLESVLCVVDGKRYESL